MTRVDPYGTVHKGIRISMFEAAAAVGRTEFADAAEAASAAAAVRRALGFLGEHARHEDAVLMPELEVVCPELFADLRSDHARLEGLEREVEALLARAEAGAEAERVAAGARLRDRVPRLVAEHLRHMAREEAEASRALWANRSDEALRALHGRIVGGIAPARMAEWLALILPAVTGPERAAMLAGLRATVPAPQLGELLGPARAALGPVRWERDVAGA